MKQQKGFTLIELIIVIIILGILAVTAAPRFFNFATDARISTLQGVEGSINGAAGIVYGKSVIAGTNNAASETADGIDIVFGYPAATVEGIIAALSLSDDWSNGPASVQVTDASGTTVRTGIAIYSSALSTTDWEFDSVADSVDPSNDADAEGCYVVYLPATAADEPYQVFRVTNAC